jgi:hypothetical protein
MKVLIVALSTARWRATVNEMEFLLDQGADVTLLTSRIDKWEDHLDPRAKVVTLSEYEGRHPLPRTERAIVFRVPRLFFAVLRKPLRAVTQAPAVGTPARVAVRGTDVVQRGYERVANVFHLRVFNRFYRNVRPVILWKVARKHALRHVDLGELDLVLVMDSQSIPIGWHLAREQPGLDVSFSLDREKWAAASAPPAKTA